MTRSSGSPPQCWPRSSLAAIFGFVVIDLKGDAIVAGLAINLLALGATTFLMRATFGVQGGFYDPNMPGLAPIDIPVLADIPFIGAVVSGQTVLVWVAVAMVARAAGHPVPPPVRAAAAGRWARTPSRLAAWASVSGASSTQQSSRAAHCAALQAPSCPWAS